MTKGELIKTYKHKLERAENKLIGFEQRERSLTPHGRWSQGWWQGRVTLLGRFLEDLEELT